MNTSEPIAPSDFFPHTRDWAEGVTHMRKDGMLCSGNFIGWIQYRQLIEGHTKW